MRRYRYVFVIVSLLLFFYFSSSSTCATSADICDGFDNDGDGAIDDLAYYATSPFNPIRVCDNLGQGQLYYLLNGVTGSTAGYYSSCGLHPSAPPFNLNNPAGGTFAQPDNVPPNDRLSVYTYNGGSYPRYESRSTFTVRFDQFLSGSGRNGCHVGIPNVVFNGWSNGLYDPQPDETKDFAYSFTPSKQYAFHLYESVVEQKNTLRFGPALSACNELYDDFSPTEQGIEGFVRNTYQDNFTGDLQNRGIVSRRENGRLNMTVLASMPPSNVKSQQSLTLDNTTLHFDFETISGTTINDLSDGSNDGTCVGMGSSCTVVAGRNANNALSLGNRKYARIPFNPVFNQQQFSIDGWVYVNSWGGDWETIIMKPNTNEVSPFLQFKIGRYFATDRIVFEIVPDNGGNGGTVQHVVSSEAFPLGQWVHIAATYDGATMKLYINGELDNELYTPMTVSHFPTDIFIGASSLDGMRQFLDGSIDEIRIWNKALTDADVLDAFNSNFDQSSQSKAWFLQYHAAEFDTTQTNELIAHVNSIATLSPQAGASVGIMLTGYHIPRDGNQIYARLNAVGSQLVPEIILCSGTCERITGTPIGRFQHVMMKVVRQGDRFEFHYKSAPESGAVHGAPWQQTVIPSISSVKSVNVANLKQANLVVHARDGDDYVFRNSDQVSAIFDYISARGTTTNACVANILPDVQTKRVTDISNYAHKGDCQTDKTQCSFDQSGGMRFDGNTIINFSNHIALNPTNAISIHTRFYPTQWSPDPWTAVLFKQNERPLREPYLQYKIGRFGGTDKFAFELTLDDGSSDGVKRQLQTTQSIPLNQWTDITVTYDRQFMKIYVNGVLDSQQAETRPIKTFNSGLFIGSSGFITVQDQRFRGIIDRASIWNVALSDVQISQLDENFVQNGLVFDMPFTNWRLVDSAPFVTDTPMRLCLYEQSNSGILSYDLQTILSSNSCVAPTGWTLNTQQDFELNSNQGTNEGNIALCLWQTQTFNQISAAQNALNDGDACLFDGNYLCEPQTNVWRSTNDERSVWTNIDGRPTQSLVSVDQFRIFRTVTIAGSRSVSCCPSNYCWNPQINSCVEGSDSPFSFNILSIDGVTHRCDAGTWITADIKYDPWKYNVGFCEEQSQCFWSVDGIPGDELTKCVDDGESVGPYYCSDGNWTTTSKLLANSMLGEYEDAVRSFSALRDNVALFCGRIDETLNYVSTSVVEGRSQLDRLLGRTSANTFECDVDERVGLVEHCAYRACVLQYDYKDLIGQQQHKALLGFALGTSQYGQIMPQFEETFGITCTGAPRSDGWIDCSSSAGSWRFEPNLRLLLYQPSTSLNFFGTIQDIFSRLFVQPLLNAFQLLLGNLPGGSGYPNVSFLEGDSLYDSLYYARFGDGQINATKDYRAFASGTFVERIVFDYVADDEGYSPEQVCAYVQQWNENHQPSSFICEVSSNGRAVIYADSTDQNLATEQWMDITARLRPRKT